MERERRPQGRNQNDQTLFVRLLRKYRKDFETNTLPEIRKRMFYVPPTAKRRIKDRKAEARRKKDDRKFTEKQDEQRENNQDYQ